MRNFNKVFEIGNPKTGTKSLGQAYSNLGLKHKGWDESLFIDIKNGNLDNILEVAKKYDAFEDSPWHEGDLYKLFDKKFPNSKFILLERDLGQWIRSHRKHFDAKSTVFRGFTKIENYDEKTILKVHLSRYQKIKDYFKGRENDLLIMNICAGEGWEKLCPFLSLPIPNKPFPSLNQTPNSLRFLIKKFLKRYLRYPLFQT